MGNTQRQYCYKTTVSDSSKSSIAGTIYLHGQQNKDGKRGKTHKICNISEIRKFVLVINFTVRILSNHATFKCCWNVFGD